MSSYGMFTYAIGPFGRLAGLRHRLRSVPVSVGQGSQYLETHEGSRSH